MRNLQYQPTTWITKMAGVYVLELTFGRGNVVRSLRVWTAEEVPRG